MPVVNYDKRICDLLAATDNELLSADQVAAKQMTEALEQLMSLPGIIKFGETSLAEEMRRYSLEQIINNDHLWSTATITNQIQLDNLLAAAALAFYLAAQMRGYKLPHLVVGRAEIEAEKRARGN